MTKKIGNNKISVKTLSVIPLGITYLISILIQAYVSKFIRFNNQYLIIAGFHIICSIILLLIFTGTLIIEIKKEKKLIKVEQDKKTLLTKTENQVISISEIENWKLQTGRGADKLKIFLKNNKVLKIDFNNITTKIKDVFRDHFQDLIDHGENNIKNILENHITQKINSATTQTREIQKSYAELRENFKDIETKEVNIRREIQEQEKTINTLKTNLKEQKLWI